MKKIIRNMNWKELFFPILRDIKNVNDETDSARVSRNNWTLASNDDHYQSVKKLIDANKASGTAGNNVIIID